jgi:hypothetical protein
MLTDAGQAGTKVRIMYQVGFMVFCKEKIVAEFKMQHKNIPNLLKSFKENLNKFKMKNSTMDRLVDKFIDTDELGHYSKEDFSVMLYDIKNDEKVIARIKKDIEEITVKYKFIILPTTEDFININILDIDL